MSEEIRAVLREYVSTSALVRSPGELTDATALSLHGTLDSIAVLELVLFIESRFGIEFTRRDLDRRHLDSVERLAVLVEQKLAERAGGEAGGRPGA